MSGDARKTPVLGLREVISPFKNASPEVKSVRLLKKALPVNYAPIFMQQDRTCRRKHQVLAHGEANLTSLNIAQQFIL